MNKKCAGCGLVLQTKDSKKDGYVPESKYNDSIYCQRCFQMIHYNKTKDINKIVNINDFIRKINKENNLVIYVLDALTISEKTMSIINKIKTNLYVVLTKKDLFPKSVKDIKLVNYIKDNTNAKNVFVVSTKTKYNIDTLYNAIVKSKNKKIYVCGYSNAGKSALINSLLESVGKTSTITVNPSPNTTLEEIIVPLNENISLMDTPGFIYDKSISNYINVSDYINVIAKKEIKPRIHLLKPGHVILMNNIRIENNSNDSVRLSFYLSNKIKLEKAKITKRDLYKDYDLVNLELNTDEDIVIEGLGFIKVIDEAKLTIYSINKNIISKRRKLV